MTEVFKKEYESAPHKAKWKFGWSVIKYFRPEFMKSLKNCQPNPFGMYNHYFEISIRNLWKNKSYSLRNILGLSAGTVSCLYFLLYVQEQYSFDDHHKNAERIFRVTTDISTSEKTDKMATISTAILPFIQEDFPEVEAAARVISCLGLFGLAAFTAEQRVKEIGIRKILGATTTSLVTLLSKDFLWLVLIACVIITPIAGWGLEQMVTGLCLSNHYQLVVFCFSDYGCITDFISNNKFLGH